MRKLLCLALLAVGVMAVNAAPAFGETEMPTTPVIVPDSIESEAGGLCGDVVVNDHVASNNPATGSSCTFEAVSESIHMYGHLSIFGEIEAARCENAFEGAIDRDGHGFIGEDQILISHHLGEDTINCDHVEDGVARCSETSAEAVPHGGDHGNWGSWEVQGYEDAANGDFWLEVEACLEGTTIGTVAGDVWTRVTLNQDGEPTHFDCTHGLENTGGCRMVNREHSSSTDVEFWGEWIPDNTNDDGIVVMD